MNKDEFVNLATRMGYCSKKQAQEYAADREEFTEADFEEVYRIHERAIYLERFNEDHDTVRGRTTKRYTVYNSHGG